MSDMQNKNYDIGTRRILLAGESSDAGGQLVMLLEQQGYKILKAPNGGMAVELAEQTRPALVLMDGAMPVMDGFSVCTHLKNQEEFKHIPILLVIEHEQEDIVARVYDAGADDYITRPVQWSCLLYRIHYQLRQQRLMGQLQEQTREIEHARITAEASTHAKSEFLANMSHELHTPMHGILSYTRFGLKRIDTAPREKLKEFFQEIEDSGSRLDSLLNDLLELARLEAGKVHYDLRTGNVVDEVVTVFDELAHVAEEKRICLIKEIPERPVMVRIDRLLIGRVLRTLVLNAIKFSDAGGEIRITVQKKPPTIDMLKDNEVEVAIRDRGIGIPAEEIGRVFDKFLHNSMTRGESYGTAMGLSICRQIIEDHGGKIQARRNPKGGAVFSFILPVAHGHKTRRHERLPSSPEHGTRK